MSNFYVGEVLFETGGTIDTPGDITVTAICDCTGSLGTNGQLLSSTGTALQWTSAGGGISPSTLTAKGDLITATAPSTPTALPVGTDGQVLTACSTCSTGMVWATSASGLYALSTSNSYTFTSGTPVQVLNFGDSNAVIDGTLSIPALNGGSVGAVWKFVKSGDPTNFNTGWAPYYQWPLPAEYDPGSFAMLYPVYPDPLANNMILEYTPATNFTGSLVLVYAVISGAAPTWMI